MSGSEKRKSQSLKFRSAGDGVRMSDLPPHQWLKRAARIKLDGTRQPAVTIEISSMSDWHLCGAVRMLIREFRAKVPLDERLVDFAARAVEYPQWPELLKEVQRRDPGHGIHDHTDQERCVADISGLGYSINEALAACVRRRLAAGVSRG
jgi:hypothetical protein